MSIIKKKYVIAGGIALVSVLGAFAYLQYKKLMDYCLSFKSIKINTISLTKMNFNLWLNFLNKSNVPFTIVSQTYDVYLDDKIVSNVINKAENKVLPKQTNTIALNVNVNPSKVLNDIGFGAINMALNLNKVIVKIDMKLKIKILGVKFNIPYIYKSTIGQMKEPNSTNSESNSSEC